MITIEGKNLHDFSMNFAMMIKLVVTRVNSTSQEHAHAREVPTQHI
jgi:hypothetical protein